MLAKARRFNQWKYKYALALRQRLQTMAAAEFYDRLLARRVIRLMSLFAT